MSEEIRAREETRRALLKKIGRYATVTAPAVTLLLAASTKPTKADVISTR